MAKSKKKLLPAKTQKSATLTKEEAMNLAEAAELLTVEELADYAAWLHEVPDFNSYRAIRKHLQNVARFHNLGLVDQKRLNAQTYIASALIIARDREVQFDKMSGDDLGQVLADNNGVVNLTSEQCLTLMQTPTDAAKVNLLRAYQKQNQQVIDAEVAPVVVSAEKPIEDQYAF